MTTGVRNFLMAVAGLSIGALFLWLSVRNVSWAEVSGLMAALDRQDLAMALVLYWIGLVLRVGRWHVLLRRLGTVRLPQVAETLLAGYAVNNVLPARLGEVARAVYAKRRLGIGRARVFGSIVIERLLDLCAILACLVAGMALLYFAGNASRYPVFELIALNAGVVVGVSLLVVGVLRSVRPRRVTLPERVQSVLADFGAGLATLDRQSVAAAAALTLGVWACEIAALAAVFAAVGVDLDSGQSLVVMGAASLSTLVPTAPGYLGSYQLVAVLAMESFDHSASAGIVATGAIQVVLFGSVTAVGLGILGVRMAMRARSGSAIDPPVKTA